LSGNGAAHDFLLTDLNGKKVRLTDYRGKIVLVNFWASWCPPCKMEIPGFQKAYETYRDRGFVVIGVAMDEVRPSFVKDMGITYPIVIADNKVAKDYGNIRGLPASFLINQDGGIIKTVTGIYFEDDLNIDVKNALNLKRSITVKK
jgi:cytochrome c biogenesis protein CcmG/thiol:disulfide interchange protein DsbE